MKNKEKLIEAIKNSMSGLLPVLTVNNIAPKIASRLEAEGVISLTKEESEQALIKQSK